MDAVFEPTRIYVKPVLKLLESVPVKGLAHITGGGLTGNVPRILQDGLRAVLRKAAWPRPEIFQWLQRAGNVAEDEMHGVFNCGVGMVAIVRPDAVQQVTEVLASSGETVAKLGDVTEAAGETRVVYDNHLDLRA